MAQAQQKRSVTLTLTGGPARESANSAWHKESKPLLEQLKKLLEYLGFDGDFTIKGVDARKGSSNSQDLKVQRPDPTPPLPGILFTAQTSGNNTCWVYRLNVPVDTDLQVLFARIRVALEEGRHMSTVEAVEPVSSNVVHFKMPDVEEVLPNDVGQILADQTIMDMILQALFEKAESLSTETPGRLQSRRRVEVLDTVMEQLGSPYVRRDGGRVIEAFILRRLLRRLPGSGDMLQFEKDCEKKLRLSQQAESQALVSRVDVLPISASLDQQVADLKSKAMVYAEAQKNLSEVTVQSAKISEEVMQAEDLLAKLKQDYSTVESLVSQYKFTLQNPSLKTAFEEFERLRKMLEH